MLNVSSFIWVPSIFLNHVSKTKVLPKISSNTIITRSWNENRKKAFLKRFLQKFGWCYYFLVIPFSYWPRQQWLNKTLANCKSICFKISRLIKVSPTSSLLLPPLSNVRTKDTRWDRVKSNNYRNMMQRCIFTWFQKQQIAKVPPRNIMNKTEVSWIKLYTFLHCHTSQPRPTAAVIRHFWGEK